VVQEADDFVVQPLGDLGGGGVTVGAIAVATVS